MIPSRPPSSGIALQSRSDAEKPRGEQISASLSVSVARSAAQQSRVRPSVTHPARAPPPLDKMARARAPATPRTALSR